jgi:hypothetical protein
MRQNQITISPAKEKLTKLKKALGPPAILSSESLKEYYAVMLSFIESFEPRDHFEAMIIEQITHSTFEVRRYRRHKGMVIDQQFGQHRQLEAKRKELAKEQKKRMAEEYFARRRAEREKAELGAEAGHADKAAQKGKRGQDQDASAPTNQLDRLCELAGAVELAPSDVDEILEDPTDEIKHAAALKADIDYYERLDHLETIAMQHLENAFRLLDSYRQGFGRRVRRLSDQIIDAEFTETQKDSPSIKGPVRGA